MIDMEKLSRIEDQHEALQASVKSLYEKYLTRSQSVREQRSLAMKRAPAEFQHLALEKLAAYTDAQLQSVGVEITALQAMRAHDVGAKRLFADCERKKKEADASGALLNRLKAHAGTNDKESWSVQK
jgi:hypothetical protein